MKKINILVMDDEFLATEFLKETLEDFLSKNFNTQMIQIYCANKINDFWKIIEDYTPEIIFIDIEMPGKKGTELIQELRDNIKKYNFTHDPFIIFCTAYDNYAYQAYKLNAIDYILKPVSEDTLAPIFNKITHFNKPILDISLDYVNYTQSNVNHKIAIKDIICFKADMKYISVINKNNKNILINNTLLQLEKIYPKFIKAHRAFLVNPDYIESLIIEDSQWFLKMKYCNDKIPISRRQKSDLESRLNQLSEINVNYID